MSPSSSLFRWALSCLAFLGTFTPVLAKHTKHLTLVDIPSVEVDRIERSFEPIRKQVEAWRAGQLSHEATKLQATAIGPEQCARECAAEKGRPTGLSSDREVDSTRQLGERRITFGDL